MGDDRAIVQVYGDKIMYRASAIGTPCLKQLIAARMEYDPAPTPAKMLATYEKGSNIEPRILMQLRTHYPAEWTTYESQQEVVLAISRNIAVVGHIDGTRIPAYRTVEVKSQSEAEYDPPHIEKSPFYERYLWQISSYMHGTRRPLDLVVVKRDDKEVSLDLDWYCISFEEPPISLADIRRRILRVEAEARKDSLPEKCEPKTTFPCPYFYLHNEIQSTEERLLVGTEDLVMLCRQHEDAKLQEKQAKERKEAVKKAIDAAIDGDDAVIPSDGGFIKVHFYEGSNSRVDPEKLKSMGIDPEPFKTKTTYRGLRVTMPE